MSRAKLPDEPVHLLAMPGPHDMEIPGIDQDGPVGLASFRREAGQKHMRFEAAWDHHGAPLTKASVPRQLRKLSSRRFVHGNYGFINSRVVFSFLDHTIYGYPERLVEGSSDHFMISRDFIFHRIKRPGEDPVASFVGATRYGPHLRHLDPLHKVTALYLRALPQGSAHGRLAWHARTNKLLSIIRQQGFTKYEVTCEDITWLPDDLYAGSKLAA
jgi:hypothetical protein